MNHLVSNLTQSLDYKNQFHESLYDKLAIEYKQRAFDLFQKGPLASKAEWLKESVDGDNVLEIWVGGGVMSRHLAEVWFQTTGVDISKNMIQNAKEMNPGWNFIHTDYSEFQPERRFDAIVWLAFIHLFDPEEAKRLIQKMYNDLSVGWIINLTTTLGSEYSYGLTNKEDYWNELSRYRAQHTPESMEALLKWTSFVFKEIKLIPWEYDKTRMSMVARKE